MSAEDVLLDTNTVLDESCVQRWSPQHGIHRDLLEQGQKPWRAGAPLWEKVEAGEQKALMTPYSRVLEQETSQQGLLHQEKGKFLP